MADIMYLAHTPTMPGYWGRHADGIHHAIASACDAGADRSGIFIVYSGHESLTCGDFGGVQWARDAAKPTKEGVFTGAGHYLGESLESVARDVQQGLTEPDEFGLSRDTVRALKSHKV